MKALEVQGAGFTELKWAERPDPKPGHGQIVVRIKAVTLNYRDLFTVLTGGGASKPFVPLSDGAGVVEAVGPGVTRWKVGDRVTTQFFGEHWLDGRPDPSGMRFALGGATRDGTAQELLAIDEKGVVATPDYLSDAESAAYTCAGVTAWRAMLTNAGLKAGDTVLLLGTGGVSIFGLQIARAMGVESIITSSSDAKLARCKEMGAAHTINYKAVAEWGAEARKLTGGRGVDAVLEIGGAGTLPHSFRATAIDGTVCVIGLVSGFTGEGTALPQQLIGTDLRVHGSAVGTRRDHEDLARAFALQGMKPIVDTVMDWADAHKAFELMQSGRHFGKIALTL